MSEERPTQQPMRKVEGRGWYRDKRWAKLSCGHRIEVSPKEAMPEEARCPECPAEPIPEPA